MKTLIKIDRIIENIQIWFCALMFVLILVFGSLQVFGRFILHSSPPWTEEAMRFCGIYLTFIGSALTVRADAHVSVDIVISFMKN
ncbi:TRAP transporter small permease, partial [Cloacibacillus porcorum]